MGIQHPDITRLEKYGMPEGKGCYNCGDCFGEQIFIYRGRRFCSKGCVLEHLLYMGVITAEWNDDYY